MYTSHQNGLLQSRKKISGEVSKEPFVDILLTDLEQSSFSLLPQNFVITHGCMNTRFPCLRASKYLFEETRFQFYDKSVGLQKQKFHQNKGKQILTTFNTAHIFHESSKSYFVKPFCTVFVSRLSSQLSRKVGNPGNLLFASFLPHQSPYLCSKVYRPSHSISKSFQEKYEQESKQIACVLNIGDYVYSGEKMGYLSQTPVVIGESGKLLRISKTQVTVQKIQPVLFYSQAEIHVESNEWVKRGAPLLTLTHQTLVTGDIVQGIPRIEQLFEASTAAPPGAALQDLSSPSDDDSEKRVKIDNYFRSNTRSHLLPSTSSFIGTRNEGQPFSILDDRKKIEIKSKTGERSNNSYSRVQVREEKAMLLYNTLQLQVREIFRKKWDQFPLPVAVRQSLEEIQQVIVESIQKVYISQGVLIADKHIEIIVRQMTSKAQIFDGGSTGLLIDEILSLQQIENANRSTPGQKAIYFPVIMGLTRSALSSDSFVSAASFQETTRVLSRDAVAGKTDFLRGLKEKVIIGDLIDAGTGLDVFYIYSLFSKTIFENKFRDILNRKLTHKTLKKLVVTVSKSEVESSGSPF